MEEINYLYLYYLYMPYGTCPAYTSNNLFCYHSAPAPHAWFYTMGQRWAAILENVAVKATSIHRLSRKNRTKRYIRFNKKKSVQTSDKNSRKIFFWMLMKRYNCPIQIGQYKNWNLKPKKDRLIKELVLQKGQYNRPIQILDLEIDKCIGTYNRKIQSVSDISPNFFLPPPTPPHPLEGVYT